MGHLPTNVTLPITAEEVTTERVKKIVITPEDTRRLLHKSHLRYLFTRQKKTPPQPKLLTGEVPQITVEEVITTDQVELGHLKDHGTPIVGQATIDDKPSSPTSSYQLQPSLTASNHNFTHYFSMEHYDSEYDKKKIQIFES